MPTDKEEEITKDPPVALTKEEKKLETLKFRRGVAMKQMDRINEFNSKITGDTFLTEFEVRLEALETSFSAFQTLQTKVEEVDPKESCDSTDARGVYEEMYYTLRSSFMYQIQSRKFTQLPSDKVVSVQTKQTNKIKLPDLKVPLFTGEVTEWLSFHETFNSLIHTNPNLNNVSKFHYLISSLSGQAAKTIQSLEITEANYDVAMNLLIENYDNRKLIATEHIKKIMMYPPIHKPSSSSLRNLLQEINSHLRALSTLGRPVAHWDDLLIQMILPKLDQETLSKWRDEGPTDRMPSYQELSKFLTKRSHTLTEDNSQASTNLQSKPSKNSRTKSFAIVREGSTAEKFSCTYCKKVGHFIYRCYQFINLPIVQKQRFVTTNNLCLNCLKPNNTAHNCQAIKCRKCNNFHHTLLHDNSQNNSALQPTSSICPTTNNFNGQSPQNFHIQSLTVDSRSDAADVTSTILATAIIHVMDKHNTPVPCRVLLDSASHVCLLTERFANLIGMRRKTTTTSVYGIGSTPLHCRHQASLIIKSRLNGYIDTVEALIVNKIAEFLPDLPINTTNWPIPSNINLADPLFATPGSIDLLIGAEHFFELLSVGQIKLGHQLPTLQNTIFGWIVSGSYDQKNEKSKLTCNNLFRVSKENTNLDHTLKLFWEVENLEAKDHALTKTEQICEDHFYKHVRRLENGSIEVSLPFKSDPKCLGRSYELALRRFLCLERKLHKMPDLAEQYISFMREYINLSHMELSSKPDSDTPHYFIPHHCITKPESSSTKLRVVFDASAKSTNGVSLNEILHVGPVVQLDLFSLLIKFRSHTYVFSADVTKMYRQFLLNESDRQFHLILWRENPKDEIKIYRLCTVTYGTTPASYLATKSLHFLADMEMVKFPLGANMLRNDFYVDDILTGAETLKKLEEQKIELRSILATAGLELRKWCSNSPQILHDVSLEDREPLHQIKEHDVVKTLGLLWDPRTDAFLYTVNYQGNNKVTKRTVLSDIATLYDPLGLINPVIVSAKIFMQSLWKNNFNWDEALPQSYHQWWITFRNQLADVDKLKIGRHVLVGDISKAQLHAFADSSERAYGACVYVRSFQGDGTVIVRLLCAKSKVAPVKNISLPRLELCAAHLMVHLVKRVRDIFQDGFASVHYWTDSNIVISWLSSESHHWQTFVANRVAAIQGHSSVEQWQHVGTHDNPADIVSRGASPHELSSSPLWFHGSSFLSLPQECWPNVKPVLITNEDLLERKQMKHTFSVQQKNDFISTLKHNNDYFSIVRTTAWLFRFCYNASEKAKKRQTQSGELTTLEIDKALNGILKLVQASQYANEISLLKNGKPIAARSHIKSLCPFIDREGLLRVGGRLNNAELKYETKHGILLPNNHPFIKVFINYLHEKYQHIGAQGLIAIIREKYWPVHANTLVRKIISKCVLCARANPRFENPEMGHLPACRVTPSRPFSVVGTDFCGPFMVHSRRRGTAAVKAYVAVFVCLSTKAIHMELVGDLTTSAFLGALRRFISRRGLCREIYSDNATNYVGARNELRELYNLFNNQQSSSDIAKACLDDGIKWHNIPPRSPHFGGIWEAAVKSAKHHMKRILHLASLTYEELNTVIVQIEGILNSRPLSPLSKDPNDLQPLTPGHFLTGTSLVALPEPDLTDKNISYLSRWQRVQWLMQQFWRRWQTEYLHTLQERKKWQKNRRSLKVNDIVIIKEDNLPPLKWKLGRVVEVHLGADNICRVVTLKTANGTTKRASTQVCRLPIFEEP